MEPLNLAIRGNILQVCDPCECADPRQCGYDRRKKAAAERLRQEELDLGVRGSILEPCIPCECPDPHLCGYTRQFNQMIRAADRVAEQLRRSTPAHERCRQCDFAVFPLRQLTANDGLCRRCADEALRCDPDECIGCFTCDPQPRAMPPTSRQLAAANRQEEAEEAERQRILARLQDWIHRTLARESDERVDRVTAERTARYWDPSKGPTNSWNAITVAGKNSLGLDEALTDIGVSIRHNTRAARTEIRRHGVFDWRSLDDRLSPKIREIIEHWFCYERSDEKLAPLKFGADAWTLAVGALTYDREVDPFLEWLENLPEWDGTPRVDRWLPVAFAVTERMELAEWASRYILLGAVTRAYHPGRKMDETPVLIGDGGIGKSTSLRALLPPEADQWFSDSLNLSGDQKERAEALQGRVIVEAAEMVGATRADIESLKAFLSRTDDGSVRLAYRRNPETMLRRAIIVGTADREHALPNDRNLRRFVPVYLGGGNPATIGRTLDWNREQLWAEALALYRAGEQAWLPPELADMQREATDRARTPDTIMEDAVEGWVAGRDQFTLAELVHGIGLVDSITKATRLNMRDQHRIGTVLERIGYHKRRRRQAGERTIFWVFGEN